MSGVEVLGAIAAASQLLEQGTKVVGAVFNLYRKVRDVPESIRQQLVQVEQLIDIAKLIEANPALQTELVSSILSCCTNEATDLHAILFNIIPKGEHYRPEKFWKALVAVSKEKRILAHLAKLEQVQTVVDGISQEIPAIRDSIRKVTTVLNAIKAIPGIAKDIEAIQSTLPDIADKITTVHDELPTVSGKVAAIHDELLPRMQEDMQRLLLAQSISTTCSMTKATQGLSSIPYARNALFVGRDAQIEDLNARLDWRNWHTRIALVGLGGIGKSQVALEYAYRRREREPQLSVFWVHADTASRFEKDYHQIGRLASVSGLADTTRDPKQLIKDWLSTEDAGSWLLVVDSADDTDVLFGNREAKQPLVLKGVSEFLPQSSNGSVLFTTRNKKAGVKFATAGGLVMLPKMDRTDAKKLLNARSGEVSTDGDKVSELLDLLDFLPLAVSQAGSYIAENSISIEEYLQMYNHSEASRVELLAEDFTDPARDSEAQNSIPSTYIISFEQITRSSPIAADLLSYMACLDDQAVPKNLLPLPTSLVKASNALGLLKAYSMIIADPTDTLFSMHRLVHLATRNWLKDHGRFKAWAEVSLTKVSEIFPPAGPETLDLCDIYLPHAQAVYAYGKYLSKGDYSQATLAQKLSWYFRSRGSYHTAVALAEEAVRAREEAHKLNDPNYYMAVENLKETLLAQSEAANNDTYKQVLPRWETWYTNWEKNLGADDQDMQHQLTLLSLMNLTASLRAEGEWEAIREIHQRMLKQRVTRYGSDHPFTKTTRETLATAEAELGLHRKSEADEQRHLDVNKLYDNWEKSLGPDHEITRRSMRNRLAQFSFRQRKLGPDSPAAVRAREDLVARLQRESTKRES